MLSLTPLERLPALDPDLRQRLATFWITSLEEFVSTTRASNQQHGSGRVALALALDIDPTALDLLIAAALPLLPPDQSFDLPVEQELGAGLVLEGYLPVDATSFDLPTSLPASVEPAFKLPAPQSQGVRNTCVAFTLAAACQMLSRDPTPLSAQFLYWAAKARDGIPGDVGTNPETAVIALQSTGICTATAWPYRPSPRDDRNPGHGPPPELALAEAPLRRLQSYRKLPATSLPLIKAALAEGHPVLIGLPIWEHWQGAWQGRHLGRLRGPLPGERRGGGHALCALGYRDDPAAPGGGYLIVRNSWGAEWGLANPDGPGLAHVPYRLILEQGLAALALETVVVASTPDSPRPTDATTHASLTVGAALKPQLATLYAEARAIQAQVNTLVAGLAALLEPAAPASTPTPPVASKDRPRRPQPTARPTHAMGGGPLRLLSGENGPVGQDLAPNGLAPSGERLLQIDVASAAEVARHKPNAEPRERLRILKAKHHSVTETFAGTVSDVDQSKIEAARWAVVINGDEQAALIKAIWPLIAWRMQQMGLTAPSVTFQEDESAGAWLKRHSDDFTRNLKDNWGGIPPVLLYRHTEDGPERVGPWLARHGVSVGPVDPRRGVPFYLLLLGRPGPLADDDPTAIPMDFQYELDIFWGVGRLCFTDAQGQHRLADYRTYAERLVQFEQRNDAPARLRKELACFATRHPGDLSTMRSADELVGSLVQWQANPANLPARAGFGLQQLAADQATRAGFERLLTADGKAPALLFSATHGLGLPLSDERLALHQGALVLQDWDGIGNVRREHWYAGEDLQTLQPNLEGMLAVLFACYGLGCPAYDEFVFEEGAERRRIASFPLVAQLPQQLLRHGALGVIGHVERAWTFAFSGTDGARAQSQPFEDVLGRLVQGRPLGDALDQFDMIRGARSMALAQELEQINFGRRIDPFNLTRLWIARNDARNYALLGDPAARLPYSM